MRRKNNFVLLEVLIAFALVSASILPFLRYPYRHMQKELDLLFQMQLTRYAQERLCEIEREVCIDKIDLRELFDKEKNTYMLARIERSITLPNGLLRQYSEQLTFKRTALRGDKKFVYSLIHIHLSYRRKGTDKVTFHTELILKQIPKF